MGSRVALSDCVKCVFYYFGYFKVHNKCSPNVSRLPHTWLYAFSSFLFCSLIFFSSLRFTATFSFRSCFPVPATDLNFKWNFKHNHFNFMPLSN